MLSGPGGGGSGGGLYLEAIKLNKENNTSPLVTLVNYFPGISRVFCGIFYFFFFAFLFPGLNIWLVTPPPPY